MKKNGRKEVSMIMFEGVTVNGDFIFNASVFLPSIGDDWKQTAFKVIAYEDGVIEIAVDCAEAQAEKILFVWS